MSAGDHIVSIPRGSAPPATVPSADVAVAEARRLYRKTLATWVIDLLTLRRGGRETPAVCADGEPWSEAA